MASIEPTDLEKVQKKNIKRLRKVAKKSGLSFDEVDVGKKELRIYNAVDSVTGYRVNLVAGFDKQREVDEFKYNLLPLGPAYENQFKERYSVPLSLSFEIADFKRFSKSAKGAFSALDPMEIDFTGEATQGWSDFYDGFKGVEKGDFMTTTSSGFDINLVFS